MTCIIGYKDQSGCVHIGGDSAASGDSDLDVRKESKVFKNGPMIFGYSGSFRMGQLLRYSLKVPVQKNKTAVLRYLCTTFVNAVRKCFKENKYVPDAKEDWAFIIGYKGHLYQIYDDFHVAEIRTPYDACGSGRTYALGAMHILHKQKLKPKTKIKRALKTAESYVMTVKGPFHFITLCE